MARSSSTATKAADTLCLPAPRLQGLVTLEQSLAQRRSVRQCEERDLSWPDIGQLLWACQGVTATAPGLCAVPIGAFDDEAVRTILGAPSHDEVLVLIPIGSPLVEQAPGR
jgi:hypothetical protein